MNEKSSSGKLFTLSCHFFKAESVVAPVETVHPNETMEITSEMKTLIQRK